jgi:hypothetical protein
MIIFFQYEFEHILDFAETFGKYFDIEISEELYNTILIEIERFCVADSKSSSGIFNL